MKKAVKILLGLATVLPILYMGFFFLFIISTIFQIQMNSASFNHQGPPSFFIPLIAAHFLTMFLMFGLLAFYIVNVFRNDRVDKDKKALWAVVILLGGMIAMPVYWYLYIWREDPSQKLSTDFSPPLE